VETAPWGSGGPEVEQVESAGGKGAHGFQQGYEQGVIWVFRNFSLSIFLKMNIIITAVSIGKDTHLKDVQQQRQDWAMSWAKNDIVECTEAKLPYFWISDSEISSAIFSVTAKLCRHEDTAPSVKAEPHNKDKRRGKWQR
jgi:hypothetical protein